LVITRSLHLDHKPDDAVQQDAIPRIVQREELALREALRHAFAEVVPKSTSAKDMSSRASPVTTFAIPVNERSIALSQIPAAKVAARQAAVAWPDFRNSRVSRSVTL
ncbi:MAG: hypothetical protein OXI66_09090, partial [Boseongicola sp.]|nr:hypothetical protein [Boseongicola sp.]